MQAGTVVILSGTYTSIGNHAVRDQFGINLYKCLLILTDLDYLCFLILVADKRQ